MAGVFGDSINSRADFMQALARARTDLARVRRRLPHDPALQSAQQQLQAVEQWTANQRTPLPGERERINMGNLVYRQFEATDDVEVYQLRDLIGALDNYLTYWPDDRVASDPKNAAYLSMADL